MLKNLFLKNNTATISEINLQTSSNLANLDLKTNTAAKKEGKFSKFKYI